MQTTEVPAETAPRPKGRGMRFLQFPLVALILAFLLMVVVQGVAGGISFAVSGQTENLGTPADLVFALAVTVLSVLAYKLVVVRMGFDKGSPKSSPGASLALLMQAVQASR